MTFRMTSDNEKVPLYGAAHERLQSCKYLQSWTQALLLLTSLLTLSLKYMYVAKGVAKEINNKRALGLIFSVIF